MSLPRDPPAARQPAPDPRPRQPLAPPGLALRGHPRSPITPSGPQDHRSSIPEPFRPGRRLPPGRIQPRLRPSAPGQRQQRGHPRAGLRRSHPRGRQRPGRTRRRSPPLQSNRGWRTCSAARSCPAPSSPWLGRAAAASAGVGPTCAAPPSPSAAAADSRCRGGGQRERGGERPLPAPGPARHRPLVRPGLPAPSAASLPFPPPPRHRPTSPRDPPTPEAALSTGGAQPGMGTQPICGPGRDRHREPRQGCPPWETAPDISGRMEHRHRPLSLPTEQRQVQGRGCDCPHTWQWDAAGACCTGGAALGPEVRSGPTNHTHMNTPLCPPAGYCHLC